MSHEDDVFFVGTDHDFSYYTLKVLFLVLAPAKNLVLHCIPHLNAINIAGYLIRALEHDVEEGKDHDKVYEAPEELLYL